ncbi:hypothetical protein JOC69_001210 [Heliobacterium gestii]|nr:hypothetical protein [Heliomicrobium gestii]
MTKDKSTKDTQTTKKDPDQTKFQAPGEPRVRDLPQNK